MTKYFDKCVTRIGETLNNVLAWSKGEEKLGLKNSLFICENGVVTQYCDGKEGEKFYEFIKNLTEEEFDNICDDFFEAIENKDLTKMHIALAVFDEIDNNPEIANLNILKRLKRVRESSERKPYELGESDGVKDFIIYKGKIYKLANNINS